jgi:hypothetical protein
MACPDDPRRVDELRHALVAEQAGDQQERDRGRQGCWYEALQVDPDAAQQDRLL